MRNFRIRVFISFLLIFSITDSFSQERKLLETFEDSTQIGKKGESKLVAKLYEHRDEISIEIDFFSRVKNQWILKNHYQFEKDPISGIDPKIEDFNNDGYKDFHYKSAIAARGANDVRTLFIYDHQQDGIVWIKNSEHFPNMKYNAKLNCVDAWLIHGCSSQVFLKIKNDSLKPIAWIYSSDRISVVEINELGNEIELFSNPTNPYDCYTRFSSYNPLVVEKKQ